MNKIMPVKAFAVILPNGTICPYRCGSDEEHVQFMATLAEESDGEPCRVIPVIITPAEEEGRRDGTDSD